MLDGMSNSIQRSRIKNLHSSEVDRQSPTGLIFLAFLRGACATVRKSTYTLRQTYVYVRNRTPVIRNLMRGYANFICHKYAVPMHKVRNHTPSYASLRRSCDFFMSTQPEYADNFSVEGTRDNATLRGPGVKGVLENLYSCSSVLICFHLFSLTPVINSSFIQVLFIYVVLIFCLIYFL